MCLEHVRKCKPKERVVYAVKHVYLDGSIGSIYNNFLWIVGKVYIARQRSMSDTPSKIEGGYFHTFKYLRDARKLASRIQSKKYLRQSFQKVQKHIRVYLYHLTFWSVSVIVMPQQS